MANDNGSDFIDEITWRSNGRDSLFQVRIRFNGELDLSNRNGALSESAVHAADLILKKGPAANKFLIGNCIYHSADQDSPAFTGAKRLVSGHMQSVHRTAIGLNLVVDRSYTIFHDSGPLMDFVRNILQVRLNWGKQSQHRGSSYHQGSSTSTNEDPLNGIRFGRNRNDLCRTRISRLSSELCGLKIEVNYLGYARKYTIRDFTCKPTYDVYFNLDNSEQDQDSGQLISVPDYFRQHRKIYLSHTDLPCVTASTKRGVVFLPMELCFVVPHQPAVRLTPNEIAEYNKHCSSQMPVQRFQQIESISKLIIAQTEQEQHEFNIKIIFK